MFFFFTKVTMKNFVHCYKIKTKFYQGAFNEYNSQIASLSFFWQIIWFHLKIDLEEQSWKSVLPFSFALKNK